MSHPARHVLFISPRGEAEPLLSGLRAAGHQVSLVEEVNEARDLLASSGFDHALLPARSLAQLLVPAGGPTAEESAEWRRSIAAVASDLQRLLDRLLRSLPEAPGGEGSRLTAEARQAMRAMSTYLEDLGRELDDEGTAVRLSLVGLEDAIEDAAVTAYESAAERKQRLSVEIDEEAAIVQTDAAKLRRVLGYVLQYASRRSAPFGVVRVHGELRDGTPVLAVSFMTEQGRGAAPTAPPEAQESAAPGAGLGRARKLMDRLGGRLWLESERGLGTTIFLALPSWAKVAMQRRPSSAYS